MKALTNTLCASRGNQEQVNKTAQSIVEKWIHVTKDLQDITSICAKSNKKIKFLLNIKPPQINTLSLEK